MQVSDINNENWQMSLFGAMQVVTGIDDVNQTLDVILRTRKGEDPLRPLFGCGLWEYLDKPSNVAIPNMKKEILSSIKEFEPRINVSKISHEIKSGTNVRFDIFYKTEIEGASYFFQFDTDGNNAIIIQPFVLNATYKKVASRYFITLQLDGAIVPILTPSGGFSSIDSLMDWVKSSWQSYGEWVHLPENNKIVLKVKPGVATFGALKIDSTLWVLSYPFPDFEGKYQLILLKNGVRVSPWDDIDLLSIGDVLEYARLNYGDYGDWFVENDKLMFIGTQPLDNFTIEIRSKSTDNTSAFSDGFNDGFS